MGREKGTLKPHKLLVESRLPRMTERFSLQGRFLSMWCKTAYGSKYKTAPRLGFQYGEGMRRMNPHRTWVAGRRWTRSQRKGELPLPLRLPTTPACPICCDMGSADPNMLREFRLGLLVALFPSS